MNVNEALTVLTVVKIDEDGTVLDEEYEEMKVALIYE